MNNELIEAKWSWRVLFTLEVVCALCCLSRVGFAANTNVSIVDFAFSPTNVVIKTSDSVTWSWVGAFAHSSTSNSNLWNSGILSHGSTFSHTFSSAGDFPYHCAVHLTMLASVTVQGQAQTNTPPTAAITSPANGAVFAAPWTGTVAANSSDSDGTVAKLELFAGATSLGIISNPPASASFNVTNLAAGNYALTVVATDNGGAATTSAAVNISVVTASAVTIGSIQKTSPTAFEFTYNTTAGLSYVVQRSADLRNWNSLATNTAAGASATFSDNAAVGGANFYRVLAPGHP